MQHLKPIILLLLLTLNLTANTQSLNHSTSYTYTDIGELNSETLPLGQTKTISYDVYGKQTQINDYQNKAIKFIYDSNDKLVRTEYADGSTVTYDYTPSGRLKSQTDAQGTITNSYDEMGRLKSQTNAKDETIAYEYDGVGNIIEIITPTQTLSKTYTARNRLASVTDTTGTTSYRYDEIGRQSSISYPNGVTTDYSYDSRNRITNIIHKDSSEAILQSFTYTLDDVGNRVQIIEKSGRTTNYEYNSVTQLTKEIVSNDPNNQNTITSYSYDEVGNLKTKTVDNTTTTYNYNANDQLIQQDSITFTYDNNGNLIAKDGTTYEYDDKNRLIKLITPNDTIEYTYDANNNRIAKVVNGDITTYLIDTNTPYAQVITESKTDGTQVSYTYGNDLITNGSNFYLTDALGSTRGLVDGGEKLTDSYNYTPYGTLTEHNGTSENNFLFTGEQRDSETDDYYLRARYYSPNSGRFLTRDSYDGTSGNPISQNHYLYTHGNPVMYTDPSGHLILNTAATLIRATTLMGIRTPILAISRKGVFDTLVKGVGLDGKSLVLELVIDFVLGELKDFKPNTDDKTSGGRRAHSKLEKAIGNYRPLGKYIQLAPEVSLCPLGIPRPNNYKPSNPDDWYRGFMLRIDIQVYFKGKLVFIADLKTGGARMSKNKCKEYSRRHHGVPVIEIIIPWK